MSGATLTLVMRHGQSEANRLGLIISDPAVGCCQFGLTAAGQAQVRASVTSFPALPAAPLILSSDFLRTRQTAEICRDALAADPVQTDIRLRERFFGRWDGGPIDAYRHAWTADREERDAGDGVEPLAQVLQRMQAVLADGRARAAGRPLLLVSHGDPLNILLTALDGQPPARHRQIVRLDTAGWQLLPPLP